MLRSQQSHPGEDDERPLPERTAWQLELGLADHPVVADGAGQLQQVGVGHAAPPHKAEGVRGGAGPDDTVFHVEHDRGRAQDGETSATPGSSSYSG